MIVKFLLLLSTTEGAFGFGYTSPILPKYREGIVRQVSGREKEQT